MGSPILDSFLKMCIWEDGCTYLLQNFVLQVTAVGHCNLSDVKCVSDETYFVLGAFTEIKGNQLSLKY